MAFPIFKISREIIIIDICRRYGNYSYAVSVIFLLTLTFTFFYCKTKASSLDQTKQIKQNFQKIL